jgi:prevent-host-death family protein
MDVSVRELRNHTARVIAAVEAGERVVLTVHGRPVADIVPREERTETKTTEQVMAMLDGISEVWAQSGLESDPGDFDLGYTTDDLRDPYERLPD